MASQHLSIELTAGSSANVIPTAYGQTISLCGTHGDSVYLHFGSIRLGSADLRADALAALDTLAAAVQAAMLELAPDRFPQPDRRDPSWLDDGVCRGCGCTTAQHDATLAGDRRGCACACHSGEPLNYGHAYDPDYDEPEAVEFDPGPEVDDEGVMSEYRYMQAHEMTENELRALAGDR